MKASRNGPGFPICFLSMTSCCLSKQIKETVRPFQMSWRNSAFYQIKKISKKKSKIFFSPNVSKEACVVMVQQLGINKTNNLGKYIGFPFKHKGRNRNEFQSMVDKVQAKLASRKTKCLSPASRLVLIKTSITAITEYTMQCYKLPTRIYDRIDKLTRDFLWGSTKEKRKLHLVGWDKVAALTTLRGLGIFQMKARNFAILAKLC